MEAGSHKLPAERSFLSSRRWHTTGVFCSRPVLCQAGHHGHFGSKTYRCPGSGKVGRLQTAHLIRRRKITTVLLSWARPGMNHTVLWRIIDRGNRHSSHGDLSR